MFLMSLAKSLPRLASMAAFLCFVVAHLLWPLMRCLPTDDLSHSRRDELDEETVDSVVATHLGMEGGGEQGALTNGDDPTCGWSLLHTGQHLDTLAHLLDPRRADEDGP